MKMKSVLGSIAAGSVVLYLLAQSAVPVSGALNSYLTNVIDEPSVVAVPPIGVTPKHIVRFSIVLMTPSGIDFPSDPENFPNDPENFCSYEVTVFFMTEDRMLVGKPTKFQLRPGETGHADLDGAVAPMFYDQFGRSQTRAIARVDPSAKKCAAIVATSLELFDRTLGETVAMTGDFSVKPINRDEPPPPSPIEPGKK